MCSLGPGQPKHSPGVLQKAVCLFLLIINCVDYKCGEATIID